MNGEARRQRLDTLGLALSGVCLVHCIALPLAAVLIPAFTIGLDQRTDHAFHWLLLALAVPISTLALWRGAVRSNDRRWLTVGSGGLALMLIGVLNVFGTDSEVPLTSVGVILLAVAHIKNFAHAKRHRQASIE